MKLIEKKQIKNILERHSDLSPRKIAIITQIYFLEILIYESTIIKEI